MTVATTPVTMIFWQKLQLPWCISVMDHPRVFLFHKMWLFLWVRLQFAGQLNFLFLFYTGLYYFISLTETRVIVELENMSAVRHYEADVSLVFCFVLMTQPSSCADGSDTSLMLRVCALGFIFVTGLYSEAYLGIPHLYFLKGLLELPHPNFLDLICTQLGGDSVTHICGNYLCGVQILCKNML